MKHGKDTVPISPIASLKKGIFRFLLNNRYKVHKYLQWIKEPHKEHG
jgi:hypothetical protein